MKLQLCLVTRAESAFFVHLNPAGFSAMRRYGVQLPSRDHFFAITNFMENVTLWCNTRGIGILRSVRSKKRRSFHANPRRKMRDEDPFPVQIHTPGKTSSVVEVAPIFHRFLPLCICVFGFRGCVTDIYPPKHSSFLSPRPVVREPRIVREEAF
jgi:hypothetical protein